MVQVVRMTHVILGVRVMPDDKFKKRCRRCGSNNIMVENRAESVVVTCYECQFYDGMGAGFELTPFPEDDPRWKLGVCDFSCTPGEIDPECDYHMGREHKPAELPHRHGHYEDCKACDVTSGEPPPCAVCGATMVESALEGEWLCPTAEVTIEPAAKYTNVKLSEGNPQSGRREYEVTIKVSDVLLPEMIRGIWVNRVQLVPMGDELVLVFSLHSPPCPGCGETDCAGACAHDR